MSETLGQYKSINPYCSVLLKFFKERWYRKYVIRVKWAVRFTVLTNFPPHTTSPASCVCTVSSPKSNLSAYVRTSSRERTQLRSLFFIWNCLMFCDNGTEKKFKVFALTNSLYSVSQGIAVFSKNEGKKKVAPFAGIFF